MHIYNDSTARWTIWRVQINWSRALTFSGRQISFIKGAIPHERGVYCVYAKYRTFGHEHFEFPTRRFSSVIYVGSGWLDDRLCAHLKLGKNEHLVEFQERHELAYRFDRVVHSDVLDWPKTVEAYMLRLYEDKFGGLPPANRRREAIPEIPVDRFVVQQSPNFDFLARG